MIGGRELWKFVLWRNVENKLSKSIKFVYWWWIFKKLRGLGKVVGDILGKGWVRYED